MGKLTLDPNQQIVCDFREGLALVGAAAGSGKTSTLVERIAALIDEGQNPRRIAAFMYNTAAADMFRKRLEARVGAQYANACTIKTFHSWSLGLLKEWFAHDPEFKQMKLMMDGESWSMVRKVMAETKTTGMPSAFVALSSFMRENMMPVEPGDEGEVRGIPPRVLKFARAFQKAKAAANRFDFADMLFACARIIEKEEAILEDALCRFDHVMVDETQDLSLARWGVVAPFGWRAKSFLIVGDPRQSLYSWAGADPGILFRFVRGEMGHPPAKLLLMPVNRRSSKPIVHLSNNISRGYDWHLGGDAHPLPAAADGPDVQVWPTNNPISESDRILRMAALAHKERLQYLVENAADASSAIVDTKPPIGVVVRTNGWGYLIELRLMAAGIPVTTRGGGAWASNEGKDMLAYLGVVDGEMKDLLRIANKPNRFISKEALSEVELLCSDAETQGADRLNALIYALRTQSNRGMSKLADDLERLSVLSWEDRCKTIGRLLSADAHARDEETGKDVLEIIKGDDDDREDDYIALARGAAGFGSYEALMTRGRRILKPGQPAPAPIVEISTVHKSKGDEWPTVIVAGVCEGHMPHKKNQESEEEIRIWYVACTRARDRLIISTGGPPSRLLAMSGIKV